MPLSFSSSLYIQRICPAKRLEVTDFYLTIYHYEAMPRVLPCLN